MGRWLAGGRTLMFYDISRYVSQILLRSNALCSGDILIYKKKHRPLKVKAMDDSMRTVMVDDSQVVWQLVDTIGERMGFKNAEEYSLAVADGSCWLHPTQTLQEQGLDEKDIVLLKKKFFVTVRPVPAATCSDSSQDQSVDRSDPIQLTLVYMQCKDAIGMESVSQSAPSCLIASPSCLVASPVPVRGTMPCQYTEACSLAGLALQIQLGDYDQKKYPKGFINKENCKDYIFQNLAKGKKPDQQEKDVITEWKKLINMTDLNAKFRYVQMCRSLRTYGVSCFEVLQPPARGTKMEPILIGITKGLERV
jgi:talin